MNLPRGKHRNAIVLGAIALLMCLGWAVTWIVGGGTGAGDSASGPSDDSDASSLRLATTQGSAKGALPEEFSILQTSNIFGGKGAHGAGGPGGPEAGFVFKGVVQAGNLFTAFVEDVNAKNVLQLAVGGSVARGQIKAIDLDAIQYESAGHQQRVEIGQNLNGQMPPPPPPAASAPPPGQGGEPQAPPGQQGRPRRGGGGPPMPGAQNGPPGNPAQPPDGPPGSQ